MRGDLSAVWQLREASRRTGKPGLTAPTPTITPMRMGVHRSALAHFSKDLHSISQPELVGRCEEFCAPPAPVDDSVMNRPASSAGHTACYVSPYGDVYPCVQFPLPCGNVRQDVLDIWRKLYTMRKYRSIRARDLPVALTCPTRHLHTCPGLAYMEAICAALRARIARSLWPDWNHPASMLTRSAAASETHKKKTSQHDSSHNSSTRRSAKPWTVFFERTSKFPSASQSPSISPALPQL